MKIKMLTTAAGPGFGFKAGEVYEVGKQIPKVLADAFVSGKYATIEEQSMPELAEEIKSEWVPEIETEMVLPDVETAVVKTPRGKKK
jgi:hypothetical protein